MKNNTTATATSTATPTPTKGKDKGAESVDKGAQVPAIAPESAKALACTVLPGIQLSEGDSVALAFLLKSLADSKAWAGRTAFQRSQSLRPTATGFVETIKHKLEDGASKEDKARTKLIKSLYDAFKACEVLSGGEGTLPQSIVTMKTIKLLNS